MVAFLSQPCCPGSELLFSREYFPPPLCVMKDLLKFLPLENLIKWHKLEVILFSFSDQEDARLCFKKDLDSIAAVVWPAALHRR